MGDDVNDIPMIRAAGLGVAMGNALEAVKAAADREAPSNDADGLAKVVDTAIGNLAHALKTPLAVLFRLADDASDRGRRRSEGSGARL